MGENICKKDTGEATKAEDKEPISLDATKHAEALMEARRKRKDSTIEVKADAYTPQSGEVGNGDLKTGDEALPEVIENDSYPFDEAKAQFERSKRDGKASPTPVVEEKPEKDE